MKEIFKDLEVEVDQNVMNRKHDEIERKNILISNDNLISDCLSKEVFYIATNYELTVFRFTEMHAAHTIVQARCLKLKAELSKLLTELVKHFSNLEITHAKHIDQTTALLTENENLKAQIHENLKCITIDSVKPRVLATGRYAIDVEPIPPRNRNNREVHLDYLKHLKESVETLREIVEEAKVERPLDSSLAFACLYTKHSQELLEYAIGTCPKDFNPQDKKHVATPLTRKKQVTFEDQCETSNSNTHKHVEQLNIQKTNVPMTPSTGVNSCTDASGSQPRSNTKKNRILPAKSVNKKKVEEHPRTNKSSLKTTNRIDSSISSQRTWRKVHKFGNLTKSSKSGNQQCDLQTPYELVHDKKPDLTFFRVFGALCYPTNDSEDLGKLQPTADIGIFIGYPNAEGFTKSTTKEPDRNKENYTHSIRRAY
ncbi:hypothetical protein Tco_0931673 [Tanacetum coccineum]